MWQHVKLSRSVPEIHWHVAGTLSSQQTASILREVSFGHVSRLTASWSGQLLSRCWLVIKNKNIALTGENRYFYNLPHYATNCLQHVCSCGQSANMCKSRGTHRVVITCNVLCATWYEGTAQLLSLTELKSHLFLAFIA